jgi:hypothetical protein
MNRSLRSIAGLMMAAALVLPRLAPAHAIEMLEAGPQLLEGVLVRDPYVKSWRDKMLILSPGTRSEQRIELQEDEMSHDMGQGVQEALEAAAVDMRDKGDRYEGVRRVALQGDLRGRMGNFRMTVHSIERPTDEIVQEVLQRWKGRVTGPEDMGTLKAAEALKLLEDMGLAEQFARDAVQLAR